MDMSEAAAIPVSLNFLEQEYRHTELRVQGGYPQKIDFSEIV
jgi:hypothetical protein